VERSAIETALWNPDWKSTFGKWTEKLRGLHDTPVRNGGGNELVSIALTPPLGRRLRPARQGTHGAPERNGHAEGAT